MSVESGIAAELHGETLATDGVGLLPRSASGMKSNFETANQPWSPDGRVDSVDKRPWGTAVPEFNIWGNSSVSETGNSIWNAGGGSLSSMWQHMAGEGHAGMKKAEGSGGESAWNNAPVLPESNGSSQSLGLSDIHQESQLRYSGFGFGSNTVELNSFRQFPGSGDGWGMPSSTTAESKSASVDWSMSTDNSVKSDQSIGWPGGSCETEKVEQQQSTWPGSDVNGAAMHARSSSAVSDSSAGKETDSGKPLSTSSLGSLDQASSSTPQPVELSPEELLIAQMVNSNEGWGMRLVRQDTPWVIETSSPSAAAVVGNVMENVGAAVQADASSVWNSPKDVAASGQYWGGGPGPAEWNSDGDIGVWNEPPSANAANPNMWSGPGGAAAGWQNVGPNSGGRINSSELATALAAAGGWPDSVAAMNKLAMNAAANNSLDKSRPTDAQWLAALGKTQTGGGWASDPIPNSWGSSDAANDPAVALMRAQLQLGAQQPRLGQQFDVRQPTTSLKIDTWNDPPAAPDTLLHPGHWGQPPVNTQVSGVRGQVQLEAQLQQLLKLGMKREDAIQKLTGTVDAMNPSRPGTSLGEPKGRMLRGQSVGEASASDALLLSQLASLQQLGGKMGNAQPQAAIGHRKQLSGGGAGWPAGGVLPGQNPVVYLQSLLQPKLQLRSRIQQDRMMTQQQKRQQLDTVNAEIDILKHQINLLQPAAAMPAMQGPVLNELLRTVALTNDATLAQQLLNQLKLEQGVTDADVKASLMDGMSAAAPEAWPAGLAAPASRFQWQDSGSGVRQMPPPGLGQDSGDPNMWGRGSGWNPANDKFKAAAAAAAGGAGVVGSSPTWLLLSKFTYALDGARIQALCLQQGLLQTFFFNKTAGHALACFMNRDDAISARAALGTFPFGDSPHSLCCADIVTSDTAKSLLASGQWTQLSTAAGLSSVAPPTAKGRGSSGTWSDGM